MIRRLVHEVLLLSCMAACFMGIVFAAAVRIGNEWRRDRSMNSPDFIAAAPTSERKLEF
jgi:hypothetical protein